MGPFPKGGVNALEVPEMRSQTAASENRSGARGPEASPA